MLVVSFGEVLIDGLPSGDVIGGAPLNVVAHLKQLGVDAGIITKIGNDANGASIKQFMQDLGVARLVQEDEEVATGYVKVTLTNGIASYEILRARAWEQIDYVPLNNKPKYIVFGSLAMISAENRKVFEELVKSNPGVQTICDINLRAPLYTKETIDFCLRYADILKINDEEMDYIAQMAHTDAPAVWLSSVYGVDKILLTKGAKGAELLWAGELAKVPAYKVRNMVDTVGAGDAFLAYFIYGMLQHLPSKEILQRASKFAGKICEQSGAIPNSTDFYASFKI